MCTIALQRESEIRKAFSRVKSDMLELKRTINKQFFKLEEIDKRLGRHTLKEEFYSFIKNLSNKLDSMEQSLASKKELDSVSQEISDEVNALKKILQRQENLRSELRLVKKLDSKVVDLETTFLNKKKFNEEFDYLNKEIMNVKKQIVREGLLKQSISQFKEMHDKVNELEKKSVAQSDFSKSKSAQDQRIKDIKAQLNSLSEAAGKELDTSNLVTKQHLKKAKEEFERELKKSKDKRDLDEFESKIKKLDEKSKQFEENKKTVSDFDKRLRKIEGKKAGDTDEKLDSLQKEIKQLSKTDFGKDVQNLFDRIERIEKQPVLKPQEQVKALKKDVAYLMDNVVTTSELNSMINSLNDKLDDFKNDLRQTTRTSKDSIEDSDKRVAELAVLKIKELMKEPQKQETKPEMKVVEEQVKKPGLISRIWQGMSNFFKEDEEEKEEEPKIDDAQTKSGTPQGGKKEAVEEVKAEKKSWKAVSDFFKEDKEAEVDEKIEEIKGVEEPKKKSRTLLKWIIIIAILTVAGYFLVFKFSQYKFIFFALVAIVVIAAIVLRGGDEEESEEEKEETIDLEDFFKEEEPKKKTEKKKADAQTKSGTPQGGKKIKIVEKEPEKFAQVKKEKKEEVKKKEEPPKKGFFKKVGDILFEEDE